MSYDPATDKAPEEWAYSLCPRHRLNEQPCQECLEEAKSRRIHEAAQSSRANHFKRQPRPVQRQMPRIMRGR